MAFATSSSFRRLLIQRVAEADIYVIFHLLCFYRFLLHADLDLAEFAHNANRNLVFRLLVLIVGLASMSLHLRRWAHIYRPLLWVRLQGR